MAIGGGLDFSVYSYIYLGIQILLRIGVQIIIIYRVSVFLLNYFIVVL